MSRSWSLVSTSSSIANGGVSDRENTSSSSIQTSISPVGSFSLVIRLSLRSSPGSALASCSPRSRTSPAMPMHHSARSASATSWMAGSRVLSATTWVTPSRSRRSMKIRLAVVAVGLHPAGQDDVLAGVGCAQLAAAMGPRMGRQERAHGSGTIAYGRRGWCDPAMHLVFPRVAIGSDPFGGGKFDPSRKRRVSIFPGRREGVSRRTRSGPVG